MADIEILDRSHQTTKTSTNVAFTIRSTWPNIEIHADARDYRVIITLTPSEILGTMNRFGLDIRSKQSPLDIPEH